MPSPDTTHLREIAFTHTDHAHTARLVRAAADEIDRLRVRVEELLARLRDSGCPHCRPDKLRQILGDPMIGVSLGSASGGSKASDVSEPVSSKGKD